MPIRYFESGILFGVAVDAAQGIKAEPRSGGQRAALISIAFSVIALEALINEVAEQARDFVKYTPNSEPVAVSAFAECMEDAERSRASLETKLSLANWVLAGGKLDRGAQPYQDFALLLRLRNDLVHFKGNESFDPNTTPEEIHDALIKKFSAKQLLAIDMQAGSWTHNIETKAMAEWACQTTANVVVDFCSKAPQGGWKTFLAGSEMHFAPYAKK